MHVENWTREVGLVFFNTRRFNTPNKAAACTARNSMKVKKITHVGEREVFDAHIEDNHNFIANSIVVHNCVTYKIGKYIQENVKSPRILTHDPSNREEVLKKHFESEDPTVLLSPSMMEGVDLADDASRFQILCKVPYPYLGDAVVKKRMNKNKLWYPYSTAKSIVQSLGRSIRNDTDYAVSYIVDSDWENFYSKNSSMLPEEFKRAIKR